MEKYMKIVYSLKNYKDEGHKNFKKRSSNWQWQFYIVPIY
jgi:hypothetical protein